MVVVSPRKIRVSPALFRQSADSHNQIITPVVNRYLATHDEIVYDPEILEQIPTMLNGSGARDGRWGAASAGSCPRAQMFTYLGLPGIGADVGLKKIYDDGRWRHIRLQLLLHQSAVVDDVEFCVRRQSHRIRVSVDGTGVVDRRHPNRLYRGRRFGVEIKGINDYGFRNFTEPSQRYRDQVARYLLVTGWEIFIFLFENKNNQQWLEMVITRDDVDIEGQRQELQVLNGYLENHILPPMLKRCTKGMGEFRTCPYGITTDNTCHRYS